MLGKKFANLFGYDIFPSYKIEDELESERSGKEEDAYQYFLVDNWNLITNTQNYLVLVFKACVIS